jgi:hypothetical protein
LRLEASGKGDGELYWDGENIWDGIAKGDAERDNGWLRRREVVSQWVGWGEGREALGSTGAESGCPGKGNRL